MVSFIQGIALLCLHLSATNEIWPYGNPPWLVLLYTVAIGTPLLLLLSLNEQSQKKVIIGVGAFTALIIPLAYYIGLQAIPAEIINEGSLYFSYVASMAIAGFLFLIYLQQYISHDIKSFKQFSYDKLFLYSWRNFLTLGLAGLFTLVFWGILMLWAALFKVIKIDFFEVLFTEEWFYYPVLSLAFGFAITVLRNQTNVIDVIKNIQQALMKYLLLVLILVLIIFLSTLPFTGLNSLWDTGSGSAIILWLQALVLFFVNAVYRDETNERPYGDNIHRFVYLGVALLPIYSIISFYGLTLRIDQYGWTISRGFGIIIWAIFASFSLGYMIAIIKKRDEWTDALSWVNTRMGIAVLLIMLALNSPLLDLRKISVSSQLSRIESGKMDYEDLDIYYFKYQLAAPGYEATEQLKIQLKDSHPEFVKNLDDPYPRIGIDGNRQSDDDFINSLRILPAGQTLPPEFQAALVKFYTENVTPLGNENYIIAVDLDNDEVMEYMYFSVNNNTAYGTMFHYSDGVWQSGQDARANLYLDDEAVIALRKGQFEIIPPRWNHLKLGETVINTN